jgi:CheY-like chemotaxis protein
MKILIAEDDLVTRELLKRVLSHMADEIVEAGNGPETLEKIESEDPDFLFTDLQMPELDGYALVEAIRNSKTHAQMPIVCMSSVKEKEEVVSLLALGIQDYILKPIRPAEVHDRFKKVIAQHSGWRRRHNTDGARIMLLVDTDPNFLELAKPILEEHYQLSIATSGAHALRVFREMEPKPTTVLVARGMPLVSEAQLCNLMNRMATDASAPEPQFWLLGDDDNMPSDLQQIFQGVLRRNFVPDGFKQELRQTLLRGTSPVERLKAHFADDAHKWAVSAARQTLRATSGQEVALVAPLETQGIAGGVAGRIKLTSPELKVSFLIACGKEDAMALASKALKREVASENDAADVLGELSNTIAGRARAALVERGWDLNLTLPETEAGFSGELGAQWDLANWYQTEGGSRVFIGIAVGDSDAPVAAGGASDAGSFDDSLF